MVRPAAGEFLASGQADKSLFRCGGPGAAAEMPEDGVPVQWTSGGVPFVEFCDLDIDEVLDDVVP
jgi:hypothetical protein